MSTIESFMERLNWDAQSKWFWECKDPPFPKTTRTPRCSCRANAGGRATCPELDITFRHIAEMDLTEVARGEPALTPLHRVQVQVQRGAAELNLDLDEVALS